MNKINDLVSVGKGAAQDVGDILKNGVSQLGFLKPLAYIMGGATLAAGLLEFLGVKLSKGFWKQLLIFAAIIGVIVSMSQLLDRHSAATAQKPGDQTVATSLTNPIPDDSGNVFRYPDPIHLGQMQNPANGVMMPGLVGGIPVSGSGSAIGQSGNYAFRVAPSVQGQSSSLTVESPESPASDSAANMRLKDAAVYNFLKTVPSH